MIWRGFGARHPGQGSGCLRQMIGGGLMAFVIAVLVYLAVNGLPAGW